MKVFYRCVVVLLVAATTAVAGDDVLAPGDPPLTREVADSKIEFWESVFGLRVNDRQREALRKLQSVEWPRRDAEWKGRWVRFLDVWQEAAAPPAAAERLRAGARRAALESLAAADADAVGTWMLLNAPEPPAGVPSARLHDVTALQVLQQRRVEQERMVRTLDAAQDRHRETMWVIIRNMGTGGRW
jgi:hypothetical protein